MSTQQGEASATGGKMTWTADVHAKMLLFLVNRGLVTRDPELMTSLAAHIGCGRVALVSHIKQLKRDHKLANEANGDADNDAAGDSTKATSRKRPATTGKDGQEGKTSKKRSTRAAAAPRKRKSAGKVGTEEDVDFEKAYNAGTEEVKVKRK